MSEIMFDLEPEEVIVKVEPSSDNEYFWGAQSDEEGEYEEPTDLKIDLDQIEQVSKRRNRKDGGRKKVSQMTEEEHQQMKEKWREEIRKRREQKRLSSGSSPKVARISDGGVRRRKKVSEMTEEEKAAAREKWKEETRRRRQRLSDEDREKMREKWKLEAAKKRQKRREGNPPRARIRKCSNEEESRARKMKYSRGWYQKFKMELAAGSEKAKQTLERMRFTNLQHRLHLSEEKRRERSQKMSLRRLQKLAEMTEEELAAYKKKKSEQAKIYAERKRMEMPEHLRPKKRNFKKKEGEDGTKPKRKRRAPSDPAKPKKARIKKQKASLVKSSESTPPSIPQNCLPEPSTSQSVPPTSLPAGASTSSQLLPHQQPQKYFPYYMGYENPSSQSSQDNYASVTSSCPSEAGFDSKGSISPGPPDEDYFDSSISSDDEKLVFAKKSYPSQWSGFAQPEMSIPSSLIISPASSVRTHRSAYHTPGVPRGGFLNRKPSKNTPSTCPSTPSSLTLEEMIKCDICGNSYRQRSIKRHQEHMHNPDFQQGRCVPCGMEFRVAQEWYKHYRRAHLRLPRGRTGVRGPKKTTEGKRNAICDECGNAYPKETLRDHKLFQHNPHYKAPTCVPCGLEITPARKWFQHFKTEHPELFKSYKSRKGRGNSDFLQTCPFCFETVGANHTPRFISHMKDKHPESCFECQNCKALSISEFAFRFHINHCQKTKLEERRKLRKEWDEKGIPYLPDNYQAKCEFCPVKFAFFLMGKHYRDTHGIEEDDVIRCHEEGCGANKFKARPKLVVHLQEFHNWEVDDAVEQVRKAFVLNRDALVVQHLKEPSYKKKKKIREEDSIDGEDSEGCDGEEKPKRKSRMEKRKVKSKTKSSRTRSTRSKVKAEDEKSESLGDDENETVSGDELNVKIEDDFGSYEEDSSDEEWKSSRNSGSSKKQSNKEKRKRTGRKQKVEVKEEEVELNPLDYLVKSEPVSGDEEIDEETGNVFGVRN